MYSLGVPIPGAVERLAEDLHPALLAFDSIRERHTLVCKRLGEAPPGGVARLSEQARQALVGAPAFEISISGIDYFEYPTRGEGPVVYLAIESPGLLQVHDRLVEAFSAIEELEGEDYSPHVTLARGGDVEAAERLAQRDIEPVTWTVSRMILWDAMYEETVTEFPLPA